MLSGSERGRGPQAPAADIPRSLPVDLEEFLASPVPRIALATVLGVLTTMTSAVSAHPAYASRSSPQPLSAHRSPTLHRASLKPRSDSSRDSPRRATRHQITARHQTSRRQQTTGRHRSTPRRSAANHRAAGRRSYRPHRVPLVAGHRGSVTPGPENTMAAFRAAASSTDVLETDVRWTSDGVMYLFHDATLDRVTDCTGPVAGLTWSELQACPVAGEPVATFEEFLDLAEGGFGQINPEIKQQGITADQARQYSEAIRAHHLLARTLAASFFTVDLDTLRSVDPQIRPALITGGTRAASPTTARRYGTVYLPPKGVLTAAKVAAFHNAGVEIWAWGTRVTRTTAG